MNMEQYGLIFDADVQIQSVTLGDAEGIYDEVSEQLTEQSGPLNSAAREAGAVAGRELVTGIKTQLAAGLSASDTSKFPLGPIHLKIANALSASIQEGLKRLDLGDVELNPRINGEELSKTVVQEILMAGETAGEGLGKSLATHVEQSLNRSLGQVARRVEEKKLALKGQVVLDKTEVAELEEQGVRVPVHLGIADKITKQVTDDLSVNLKVKNYSVIKKKLAEIKADIQLTPGAIAAVDVLNSLPKSHTLDLKITGAKHLKQVAQHLGKLASITVDASNIDFTQLKEGAVRAGEEAANAAAQAFRSTWRKQMQDADLHLNVAARIARVEAPADMPTVGVRAQTEQVAEKTAEKAAKKTAQKTAAAEPTVPVTEAAPSGQTQAGKPRAQRPASKPTVESAPGPVTVTAEPEAAPAAGTTATAPTAQTAQTKQPRKPKKSTPRAEREREGKRMVADMTWDEVRNDGPTEAPRRNRIQDGRFYPLVHTDRAPQRPIALDTLTWTGPRKNDYRGRDKLRGSNPGEMLGEHAEIYRAAEQTQTEHEAALRTQRIRDVKEAIRDNLEFHSRKKQIRRLSEVDFEELLKTGKAPVSAALPQSEREIITKILRRDALRAQRDELSRNQNGKPMEEWGTETRDKWFELDEELARYQTTLELRTYNRKVFDELSMGSPRRPVQIRRAEGMPVLPERVRQATYMPHTQAQRQANNRKLVADFSKFAQRVIPPEVQGEDTPPMHHTLLQLTGELIESYSQNRAAGVASGSIETLPVSPATAAAINELAAKYRSNVRLKPFSTHLKPGESPKYRVPVELASALIGPQALGSSVTPIEAMYVSGGNPGRMRVHSDNTLKNIAERQMVSGMVLRNAASLHSPDDFVDMYRREFKTDQFVKMEVGDETVDVPVFAGPVYDRRFMQMAAATGYINPPQIKQYKTDLARARELTNPEERAKAEEAAVGQLRGGFRQFLTERLGMPGTAANLYSSNLDPARAERAVERYSDRDNKGQFHLMSRERLLEALIRDGLHGDVSRMDAAFYAGDLPTPAVYEELGMHGAMHSVVKGRARAIPSWQKVSMIRSHGSPEMVGDQNAALKGKRARELDGIRRNAEEVVTAGDAMLRMGNVLTDMMGFDPEGQRKVQERVLEAIEIMENAANLPLHEAMVRVQLGAQRMKEIRHTVRSRVRDSGGYKGTAKDGWTNKLLWQERGSIDRLLNLGNDAQLDRTMEHMGLDNMPAKDIQNIDIQGLLHRDTLRSAMQQYTEAVRSGASKRKLNAMLDTNVFRLKGTLRSEKDGAVTFDDDYVTLRDLIEAQEHALTYLSPAVEDQNRALAERDAFREYRGEYKRGRTGHKGMTLSTFQRHLPEMGARLLRILPQGVQDKVGGLASKMNKELVDNGFVTEGVSQYTFRELALAKLDEQANQLTLEEFAAYQQSVLATRFGSVSRLMDLDAAGRPMIVGKDHAGPKVYSDLGGDRYFALKAGSERTLERLYARRMKGLLKEGGGTSMGTLDQMLKTRLNTMGFVAQLGTNGGPSTALRYQTPNGTSVDQMQWAVDHSGGEGAQEATQIRNMMDNHFVGDAPDVIQQILRIRDEIDRDPLGAATRYIGERIKEVDAKIASNRAAGRNTTNLAKERNNLQRRLTNVTQRGEAVNPFEILKYVRFGSSPAMNILAQQLDPVLMNRVIQEGPDMLTEDPEKFTRLNSMGLSVRYPDGVTEGVLMNVQGPDHVERQALSLYGASLGRKSELNPYAKMLGLVEGRRRQLTPHIDRPIMDQFNGMVTALGTLARMDEEGYGSPEGRAAKREYARFAQVLTPFIGRKFAQSASMYGERFKPASIGSSAAGTIEHHLGQEVPEKMTMSTALIALDDLNESATQLEQKVRKMPNKTDLEKAERSRLTQLVLRARERVRRIEQVLLQNQIAPALPVVEDRVYTESDIDRQYNRRMSAIERPKREQGEYVAPYTDGPAVLGAGYTPSANLLAILAAADVIDAEAAVSPAAPVTPQATRTQVRRARTKSVKVRVKPEAPAPEPAPATAGVTIEGNEIAANVKGFSENVSAGMYDTLYGLYTQGKVKEQGQPSVVLQGAAALKARGLTLSREQFPHFAQNFFQASESTKGDAERQKKLSAFLMAYEPQDELAKIKALVKAGNPNKAVASQLRNSGWKMHLNFDRDQEAASGEVDLYLKGLQAQGLIQKYKIGKDGDQDGKASTVYVGHRDALDFVANKIDYDLGHVLTAPGSEVLADDMRVTDKVYARFDVQNDGDGKGPGRTGPRTIWAPYGRGGHPLHMQYQNQMTWGQKATPEQMDEFYRKSQEEAAKMYGAFYTGTPKAAPTPAPKAPAAAPAPAAPATPEAEQPVSKGWTKATAPRSPKWRVRVEAPAGTETVDTTVAQVVTDAGKATDAVRKTSTSRTSATVGDAEAKLHANLSQAQIAALIVAMKAHLQQGRADGTVTTPVVPAGHASEHLDPTQIERELENVLMAVAEVAQKANIKLSEALVQIASKQVNIGDIVQNGGNGEDRSVKRREEDPDADTLYRADTPYSQDQKINQGVLRKMEADLISGKLTPQEYAKGVIGQLNLARAGYVGSAAQAGSLASVAGDRLREEERSRAVRVLGPANVTQRDFFKYNLDPAKEKAARLLYATAKRENLPLDKLVQAVSPSIRNVAQYDPAYIRSLISDSQFQDLVRSGDVKAANDRLRVVQNGGRPRREVLKDAFGKLTVPGSKTETYTEKEKYLKDEQYTEKEKYQKPEQYTEQESFKRQETYLADEVVPEQVVKDRVKVQVPELAMTKGARLGRSGIKKIKARPQTGGAKGRRGYTVAGREQRLPDSKYLAPHGGGQALPIAMQNLPIIPDQGEFPDLEGMEFFHGGLPPNYNVLTSGDVKHWASLNNLFGHGLYLTNQAYMAHQYAKTGGTKADNTGGAVHRVKLRKQHVWNLDRPATEADADMLHEAMSRTVAAEPADSPMRPGMESRLAERPMHAVVAEGKNRQDLVRSYLSRFPGHARRRVYDNLLDVSREKGYTAYIHTGGGRMGPDIHSVAILLGDEKGLDASAVRTGVFNGDTLEPMDEAALKEHHRARVMGKYESDKELSESGYGLVRPHRSTTNRFKTYRDREKVRAELRAREIRNEENRARSARIGNEPQIAEMKTLVRRSDELKFRRYRPEDSAETIRKERMGVAAKELMGGIMGGEFGDADFTLQDDGTYGLKMHTPIPRPQRKKYLNPGVRWAEAARESIVKMEAEGVEQPVQSNLPDRYRKYRPGRGAMVNKFLARRPYMEWPEIIPLPDASMLDVTPAPNYAVDTPVGPLPAPTKAKGRRSTKPVNPASVIRMAEKEIEVDRVVPAHTVQVPRTREVDDTRTVTKTRMVDAERDVVKTRQVEAEREVTKTRKVPVPVTPEKFEEAHTLFGANFMETALNPGSNAELRTKAEKILTDWLRGSLDRNTAQKAGRELLQEFNRGPENTGTRFSREQGENSNTVRKNFHEQVFAQSQYRQNASYRGLSDEDAYKRFVRKNPEMSAAIGTQLDRLKPVHGTLSSGTRQILAGQLDSVMNAKMGVRDGLMEEGELQSAQGQLESTVGSIRNADKLRANFTSFLQNPNMILHEDSLQNAQRRLEFQRMKAIASPKQLQAIRAGDLGAMAELSDTSRHIGERIRMVQNGVVNMAAFAASSLIQAAVTGIVQGLVEQETALRAVRAAVNMSGGRAGSNAELREQGGAISRSLGIKRSEALTLLAQTGTGNTRMDAQGLVKLRGILNATGETVAELTTFYGGLKSLGVQDRTGVTQMVVSRGLTLKQAETNRELVAEGLKNYGSDENKARVLVGASEVSGLKDWKLGEATTTRERQMRRLEQYGAEKEATSSTSLPMDRLQQLSMQTQETIASLSRLFQPLIAVLGGVTMGILKFTKGIADFLGANPLVRLATSVLMLAGTIKMLSGMAEIQIIKNMAGGVLNAGKNFLGGVLGAPGKVAGAARDLGDSPLGKFAKAATGAAKAWFDGTKVGAVTNTAAGAVRTRATAAGSSALGKTFDFIMDLPSRQQMGQSAGAALQRGLSWITSTGKTGVDAVKAFLPTLASLPVVGKVGPVLQGVGSAALAAGSTGLGWASSAASGIGGALAGTRLGGAATAAGGAVLGGARGLLGRIPWLNIGGTGGAALGGAMSGAMGAIGGLLSGPVGWAALAGGALIGGGLLARKAFGTAKQRGLTGQEQVTAMSVSGTTQGESLDELAAAYGGDLTPAMEAAGYSVEEVRKKIDDMAKHGVGRTRELAREVQRLARDYQLAGEFSKSLTSNLQTRIPAAIQTFKDRGMITFTGKAKALEGLKEEYGGKGSDVVVNDAMMDYMGRGIKIPGLGAMGGTRWKSLDDRIFRGLRGFFAGKDDRYFLARAFNIGSASEAYATNPDIIADENAQERYQRALGAQDVAREGIDAHGKRFIDKKPGYTRLMYQNAKERLEAGGYGGYRAFSDQFNVAVWEHFGYGNEKAMTDLTITRENFKGTDKEFDFLATLGGIEAGRIQSIAAVQKQFEKDGLHDFSEKSLNRLRQNPKAYSEMMQALGQVNQQESETITQAYEANVQSAVLRATAPGVLSDKVITADGKGNFTAKMLGAINDPSAYAEQSLYAQPGIKLRQAEAQREATLQNIASTAEELDAAQRQGLITNVERMGGSIVGFTVNTEKLKDTTSNTYKRLTEMQDRVAQAGGALGELALQIRQLNVEEILKQAIGEVNTESFQDGTVTLGGVIGGTQQQVSAAGGGTVQFVRNLQESNMTSANVSEGGAMTMGAVANAMNVFQGGVAVTQLPGERAGSTLYGVNGHGGVDLALPSGGSVKSFVGGKVIFTGIDNRKGMSTFGNRVLVQDAQGYVHAYSHLKQMNVSVGQEVKAGQMLGIQGGAKGDPGAGTSTGAHLDYTLYRANPNGQLPFDALRDAQSYQDAGLTAARVPANIKLDKELQALLTNPEFAKNDGKIQNLSNRVTALRKRYQTGQIKKPEYEAGLMKLMAEGQGYVGLANTMLKGAYKRAGLSVSEENLIDDREILTGVITSSGAAADFEAMIESGTANQQTRNLMRSAQMQAEADRVGRSGDGTVAGNAKATRTKEAMTAVSGANATFTQSVTSATTPLLQKVSKMAGYRQDLALVTKTTADGYEYSVLSDWALAKLTAQERNTYRASLGAAGTTRSSAMENSAYQTQVSEGRTRMQGLEQKIALELAQTPRTEVEKVQYQIKQWQALLNSGVDNQTAEQIRVRIAGLNGQLAEAQRSRANQRADNLISGTNASNDVVSAASEDRAGDLEYSGNGTIAGNTKVQREAQYLRSKVSAEQSFARTMNGLAQNFRTRYTNTPEAAYETRKTASGISYKVLNQAYVDAPRFAEWQNSAQAAQGVLENSLEKAGRERTRAEGQSIVQLTERSITKQLAGKEQHQYLRLGDQIAMWKEQLRLNLGKLDQFALEAFNTRIEDLQNQQKDLAPEYFRQVKEQTLNLRGTQSRMNRLLGGELGGTDFQLQSFGMDKQILEAQKVLGKDDARVQAAWKQANRLRVIAPVFDASMDRIEQGKLNGLGKVGWQQFQAQDKGMQDALDYAKENIKGKDSETIINRLFGDQLTQRAQMLRQYEQAGKQAALRVSNEQATLDIMRQQVSVVRTLTNGSLADVMQARVQGAQERQANAYTASQRMLEARNEQDNATYSYDSLKLMAGELGLTVAPDVTYDDLNKQVADARVGAAKNQQTASDAVSRRNAEAASAQRLSGLLEQPLGKFETVANRITAINAARADTPDELETPLASQLSKLTAGPDDYTGFDTQLNAARDLAFSRERVGDAALADLFGRSRGLAKPVQALVQPVLNGLVDSTEAAANARLAKAQNMGLNVADELRITEADLSVAKLTFGGAGLSEAELRSRAQADLNAGTNIEQATRLFETLRRRDRLTAQIEEIKTVTQPLDNMRRDLQDVDRTGVLQNSLTKREGYQKELGGTFSGLSKGVSVTGVLAMSSESLTSLYGDQATRVKTLAEALRTLGIEIEETGDKIAAEVRMVKAETATLGLTRTVERGGTSEQIMTEFKDGSSKITTELRDMLKNPADLQTALDAARTGNTSKLQGLLKDSKEPGSFQAVTGKLDGYRSQGVGAYMSATVRELTGTRTDQIAAQLTDLTDTDLPSAIAQITPLLTQGDAAADTAFGNVLTSLGRGERNEDGTVTVDGTQYASVREAALALTTDTTGVGEAARFVAGGGGRMTAAGAYLGAYLPASQTRMDGLSAQGDFTGAQGVLNSAYAGLALVINRLLSDAGIDFQVSSDPARAAQDAQNLGIRQGGLEPVQQNVVRDVLPLLQQGGVQAYQGLESQRGEQAVGRVERRFAANQPLFRSEAAMLRFEREKLTATNAALIQNGTVKVGAGGTVTGQSARMVEVYNQNLRRMADITEEQSLLMLKQWNDMLSSMVDDLKNGVTEAVSLVVSELLTGSQYGKKVAELDRNYGNKITNVEGNLETYTERRDLAEVKMNDAARTKGTGSREYLSAKEEYEFYNQKILEMKDNVMALNTEWEQQKFELKTIGELLTDIFDNLANQIINKTIGRFVDWGLDAMFGSSGGGSGSSGGVDFLGFLGQAVGGIVSAAGGSGAATSAGSSGSGFSVGNAGSGYSSSVLTGQSVTGTAGGVVTSAVTSAPVAAGGGVLGIKGLDKGAVAGAMTSYAVTSQSGNPLAGIGMGALQMGLAGGLSGMAAAGGSLAAFGPGAIAALSNPIGWAALAVGGAIGMIVSVSKDHAETRKREAIQEAQGVSMYGVKPGQFVHRPGTQPNVNVNMQVQSLEDYTTSRELSRKVGTESRMKALAQGGLGVRLV